MEVIMKKSITRLEAIQNLAKMLAGIVEKEAIRFLEDPENTAEPGWDDSLMGAIEEELEDLYQNKKFSAAFNAVDNADQDWFILDSY
jgi:hypothetical protein